MVVTLRSHLILFLALGASKAQPRQKATKVLPQDANVPKHMFANQEQRILQDGNIFAQSDSSACGSDACPAEHNINEATTFTYQHGLGESPGVPGIEFLGLGYHILFGNPRGTDTMELVSHYNFGYDTQQSLHHSYSLFEPFS